MRKLTIFLLVICASNVFAQGEAYWRKLSDAGSPYFTSPQALCDHYIQVGEYYHPGTDLLKTKITFLRYELYMLNGSQYADCYYERCDYTHYFGTQEYCGEVQDPTGYQRHCGDFSVVDYANNECTKHELTAKDNNRCEKGAGPRPLEADPCDPLTGNVLYNETDISAVKDFGFSRHYESMGVGSTDKSLGNGWVHQYAPRIQTRYDAAKGWKSKSYDSPQRACTDGWRDIRSKAFGGRLMYGSVQYDNGLCKIMHTNKVAATLPVESDRTLPGEVVTRPTRIAIRPNGASYVFYKIADGQWQSIDGGYVAFSEEGDNWILTFPGGSYETYGTNGYIQKATAADGQETLYTYNTDNQLIQATHPLGQTINFEYIDNKISRVTSPGGSTSYDYDAKGNLIKVTYPDDSTKQYLYEDPNYPGNLTGIIDENGVRSATWAYNKWTGRVIENELTEGVERYTFAYSARGASTVTDALGAKRNYNYDVVNGQVKMTNVTGDRCDTCGHRDDQQRSYDDQGRIISRTNWNGVTTTYERDPTGLELSRTEAAGTPEARTITTDWHPDFRKPLRITEPERIIEYTYDSAGRLLSRTERPRPTIR